jgi:hypothetical protein
MVVMPYHRVPAKGCPCGSENKKYNAIIGNAIIMNKAAES